MRRQGKLQCTRDILTSFQFFPVDNFCRRYCVFQEDAIMAQQTTPKLKSVVAMTTVCVILAILCCNLPQADSLGSECYTITGLDYRGSQDKIGLPPEAGDLLKYTECLPWNTSVESTKPRARERGIGNHNYCRNPDGDILPWCKIAGIEGSDGAWGYCHLPTCQVPGYVGCFPNRGDPSALDGITILHKDMTVGACIDFCRRNEYRYAGLEAGHACYCGNGAYNRYGESDDRGTHCANKCFGNKAQPCGGDGYVDVYRANVGSCGSESSLRTPSGAIYSPGYPDYPASPAMVTSLGATENMMRKYRDDMEDDEEKASELDKKIASAPKKPDEKCEWKVDIKKASEINMIIRKIDTKRKLGGVIEIEADGDAAVFVISSSNSNVTSSVVWITESATSRHDIDVVVPDESTENGNTGANTDIAKTKPQWSAELAKRKWRRYKLSASSLESKVSINGGAFSVRFLRNSDLISSLKTAFEFPRARGRSRRKLIGAEWSRFVVEYDATFPEGVTYTPQDDTTDDVIQRKSESRRNNGHKKSKTSRTKQQNTEIPRKIITTDGLANTKFSISQKDAWEIKKAVSGSMGLDMAEGNNEGSNSPIQIEVIVEPVDASSEKSPESKPAMSEFMVPLLLAVLLATTAILVLSAVLVFYRRGGISAKRNEKPHQSQYSRGLVVECPPGRDQEKSGSSSNLSTSSTADSVLLTDSDTSKYSPKLTRREAPTVSPETIKDLMEFLKSQPGLIKNHPPLEADQYSQVSPNQHFFTMGNDSRHDDIPQLPGPCAHCCGCSEDNRAHRHGDSCRAHHSQGKYGRQQIGSSTRSSGGKNPRGLSIRTSKPGAVPQPSLAPPLSPISEVSSVTSSMMSLPITSANSQTSLLKQAPKNSPHKVPKKDRSDKSPESEAFLASESDAESGISERSRIPNSELTPGTSKSASKLRFSDKISEKSVSSRYLGGITGACYDSGYATSNYEEDEEKASSDVMSKGSKNFSLTRSSETETNNVLSS